MTREEAASILKSILADWQRTAKDTDNVACCLKYGFITYGKAKECINVLEQEPFINKPCISSGVCEHDKNKVLDKIRAEIEEIPADYTNVSDMELLYRNRVLDIIDKYKADRSVDDGNDI